ncbi:next to BRCA1 gene 1 protein isoform X2 [Tiliqua scincoides]|uniref:next to BRCA1 gene 1 protein isoform X2 n=1 Tax=Tiliqua scincoides TaxID=71010 RepID=UPI0034618678
MDPQVNLSVTFRGDTQSFLVSDSMNTTWADVEAMVKVSFDLDTIQIKYLDEDHDEVSVNTAEEYEEALKIAVKQGNRLQMNVYELNAPPDVSSPEAPEKSEKVPVPKDGKKPLSRDSLLTRTLGQGRNIETENEKTWSEHHPIEDPPEWFTSYLERFREQVVQETVETVEQKLTEKLLLSNSLSSSSQRIPANSSMQGSLFDWLLSCSNCQAPIVGIRYQCSICPSYSICELCEAGIYTHDPNHVLLKLRRPVMCVSETYNLGQFSPRLAALEQVRLQKQMDKRFLKAEKQRLRAEKKQRKAEVRELKKQLKLHRKIHLWNSVHTLDNTGLTIAKSESLQPNTLLPLQGCPVIVPTLSASFVDENLPDGTHLQPRTSFIKHWHMKNTGNMEWSSDTKLKFMWGNLTLAFSGKRDVIVPALLPGQVGVVSVEFVAPPVEGTYTSHWRLSHRGEQFGPRIWCSIVVDPSASNIDCSEGGSLSQKGKSHCKKEDLLSFELLDINIVQELEQVPHNTPVDMTPLVSPLPHDSSLLEKADLDQIQEEREGSICEPLPDIQVEKGKPENPASQEEGEEDMSGTQFVCETVIRSLTLDAAPDHKPLQRKKSLQSSLQDPLHYCPKSEDSVRIKSSPNSASQEPESMNKEKLLVQDAEELSDGEAEDDAKDEVRSQASSTSSEDYIIILPECFDTSRPLGESMYSSALSQTSLEKVVEAPATPEGHPTAHTINILTTSQTLDEVPLVPQILEPQPARTVTLSQSNSPQETSSPREESEVLLSAPDQIREDLQEDVSGLPPNGIVVNTATCPEFSRHTQVNSLAGGLVKGALSVAASAYKALFAGPPSVEQTFPVTTEEQTAPFLANLNEMGFCDRQLNLRLLRKHNCDMAQVVTELLQLSHGDCYGNQY